MRDIPRITFLVIMDALALGLLVTMLSSCAETPAKVGNEAGSRRLGIAAPALIYAADSRRQK